VQTENVRDRRSGHRLDEQVEIRFSIVTSPGHRSEHPHPLDRIPPNDLREITAGRQRPEPPPAATHRAFPVQPRPEWPRYRPPRRSRCASSATATVGEGAVAEGLAAAYARKLHCDHGLHPWGGRRGTPSGDALTEGAAPPRHTHPTTGRGQHLVSRRTCP